MKTKLLLLLLVCVAMPGMAQMVWHNPVNQPRPVVQGRYWNHEMNGLYQRLPPRAERNVRKELWNLALHNAGLYIQFYSDASDIEVRYTTRYPHAMSHMPLTGSSGVDLYATNAKGKQVFCPRRFSFKDTISFRFNDIKYQDALPGKGYEYCLYLPLYDGVTSMKIGVPADSYFEFVPAQENERPIVVYGTSIAQGGCASRPGMAWSNILHRMLKQPFYNLAFSGNGRLEEEMFRLMSEIDASLFIIDCMPNMQGNELLPLIQERMKKGIEILRKKTDAPILLVEHDGYMGGEISYSRGTGPVKANIELKAVYNELKDKVSGLYYMTLEELGLSMDSQVDGIHATDLGMKEYADSYYKKIKEIL